MIPWSPALEPRLREALIPGALLLALFSIIAYLSRSFIYGSDMLGRPIIPFVIIAIISGIVFLIAAARIHRLPDNTRFLITLFLVGLSLRAIMFVSNPILEDDYYRYLWEGGMVANGYSPYAWAPDDADFYQSNTRAPTELVALAQECGEIHDRVNHSALSTVYPPVAQSTFALSHIIAPWSLTGWRAFLLMIDCATFGFILLILKKIERPLAQSVIYWWNPILIKETFNSAHMDVVIILFITLAILLLIHNRLTLAGIALAFATATKLWPVILTPFFLRHARALKPERTRALILSAIALLLLMSPLLLSFPPKAHSGFLAYGERWEMNDALFMAIQKATELATSAISITATQQAQLARLTVALILLLWIYKLQRRDHTNVSDFLNHLVLATGLLFMLSPTQFPWYYIWMLPLLALSPRPSYLILTAFLPLYYLRFHFAALNQADTFHHIMVWIEFTPSILLLSYEHIRFRLRPAEYMGFINA